MTEQAAASHLMVSARRRRWVFAATAVAMFMAAIEATIVATAMPTIVADLGGFHLFSWVFAAYLLTQAVTIPIYGRLADLYGRKRVFQTAAAIFLVGSTLCGFARGMAALVSFRALQGLGAGGIVPIATTILGDIYPAAERPRVQAYVAGIWGASAIIGPMLGAVVLVKLDWPVIFWLNLPIGVAAMALLGAALEERLAPRRHRVDWPGAVLMMAASGTLILVLVQGASLGYGAIALLLAVSAGTGALFFLHEMRVAEPIFPLDLWRSRIIAGCNLGGLAIGAVLMGVNAFLPTYVQGAMGRSALVAGFALTAMSAGWPVGSAVSSRVMVRTSYRLTALAGALLLVAGSGLLVALTPARGPLWAGAGAFLAGLGLGFSNTTFIVAAQSSVDWGRRGLATSSNLFMRMFGQAVGAAVFGGLLNIALARRVPDAGVTVDRLMDPALRPTLSAGEIDRLTGAVAGALHEVYLAALCVALLALGLVLLLPRGLSPLGHEKEKK